MLEENFDTQVQSEFSFQTNSAKGNMLHNQNNFSNKRNSFIPRIKSNLTTPVTSDPDLKSSIHSTHSNSKTLELFNKRSVVNLTIEEILTERLTVSLIFPKDRKLPRSFNDRTSHINKTDKSINNNMPALRNHSSSETTVEQKINAPDNPFGNYANFPNLLMSVNNLYNFNAHPWSKNTILIAGYSNIHGINEKLYLETLNQLNSDVLVEPQ